MPKIESRVHQVIDRETTKNELLSILLKNRNVSSSAADTFFHPTHPKALTPTEFGLSAPALGAAKDSLKSALTSKSKILIYGDYDVDGLTSTAIMWQTLTQLGANVLPFIPHREKDGYGFRYQSLRRFEDSKKTHFDMVITVDNGIVAHQELAKLVADGRQVIVVDHHLPDGEQDPAINIVHSTQVSGSILSWVVAHSLDPNADLGLAALGAVADCVPLLGVNRSVVVYGLQSLRLNPNIGLKKLMEISRCRQDSLSTYDLGFILGPRLNAVGRLSDPTDALRLLCSPNLATAAKYARVLEDFNRDRQLLQGEHLEEAEKMVKENQNKVIVIASPKFSPGIIGLVAGRLLEKYHLPSVVISIEDSFAKGSCRSIQGLNIIDLLRSMEDLFMDLGGHAAAAGFTIATKNIPELQKRLAHVLNKKLSATELEPVIEVDARMKLSAVNLKNIDYIKTLEPFGVGNPEPLFAFEKVQIRSKRLLGQTGDHLRLNLDDPETKTIENTSTTAIAFKKGDMYDQLHDGDVVDIVARLEANVWQHQSYPQLVVKEIIKGI